MAKQKIAVISTCSILLLAMVVAVTFNFDSNSDNTDDSPETKSAVGTSTSNKAIKDICRPADYKKTCENSLASEAGNTTDPKELVKAAFKVTEKEVRDAIQKSSTLQDAAKDPRTADAYKSCQELLSHAVDDLYRSFQKFNISDIEKWDDYAYDLKIWLSGTVACQETCLEGFKKTEGENGKKMTELLTTSRELTANALAIVDDLTKAYASLTGSQRRLLSHNPFNAMFGILSDKKPSDDMPPDETVYRRRKVLATDAPAGAPEAETPGGAPGASSTPSGAPATPAAPSGAPATPAAPTGAPSGAPEAPAGAPAEARPMADKSQANAVVAQDGSGTYKTIGEALKAMPIGLGNTKQHIIYVKAGVYQEYLNIDRNMSNLVLIGDGPNETKITGNKSVIHDHITTYHTSTVGVDGFGFTAINICFENTAGNSGEQAVALRVSSDQSVFYNCRIDGYQDTLYAHAHRQFYRDCTIVGTIDYIFGDSAAVFQNCTMLIRKPGENQACMVTAHGRKFQYEPTGFVLQNCYITADPSAAAGTPFKSYLGRPWREFAKTIVMNSKIDSVIAATGWEPWPPNLFTDTCWYAEYENTGPAADTSGRVTWPGIKHVTKEEAEGFFPGKYLRGGEWIPSTGVPYNPGNMP